MVSSFGAESVRCCWTSWRASIAARRSCSWKPARALLPETLAYKDVLVEWLRLEICRSGRARRWRSHPFRRRGRSMAAPSPTCAPHPQTGAARPRPGRVRQLDGPRSPNASRAACGQASNQEQPGHQPVQARPAGRFRRWMTFGAPRRCANCPSIRSSLEVTPPSAANPAHGRSRRERQPYWSMVAAGRGPNAESIAAKSMYNQACKGRIARRQHSPMSMHSRALSFSRSPRHAAPCQGLNFDGLAQQRSLIVSGLRFAAFALRPYSDLEHTKSRRIDTFSSL